MWFFPFSTPVINNFHFLLSFSFFHLKIYKCQKLSANIACSHSPVVNKRQEELFTAKCYLHIAFMKSNCYFIAWSIMSNCSLKIFLKVDEKNKSFWIIQMFSWRSKHLEKIFLGIRELIEPILSNKRTRRTQTLQTTNSSNQTCRTSKLV